MPTQAVHASMAYPIQVAGCEVRGREWSFGPSFEPAMTPTQLAAVSFDGPHGPPSELRPTIIPDPGGSGQGSSDRSDAEVSLVRQLSCRDDGRGLVVRGGGAVNEEDYTAALNELYRSIGELDEPDLLQSVVLASTEGRTGRIRMLRAMQALRREYETRSARAERVLSRLNEVVRTDAGGEVQGISIVIDEDVKSPLARSVDVTAEGRQLDEIVDLLTDLMNDVEADDDSR
ncbi:hypothetical protein GCM10009562_42530 [Nocardioides aquaticus]